MSYKASRVSLGVHFSASPPDRPANQKFDLLEARGFETFGNSLPFRLDLRWLPAEKWAGSHVVLDFCMPVGSARGVVDRCRHTNDWGEISIFSAHTVDWAVSRARASAVMEPVSPRQLQLREDFARAMDGAVRPERLRTRVARERRRLPVRRPAAAAACAIDRLLRPSVRPSVCS